MKIIDGGFTPVGEMLAHLTDFFQFDLVELHEEIKSIENHEGAWTIVFHGTPRSELVIALAALFETVLSYDWIIRLVYNGDVRQSFENVGGSNGTSGLVDALNAANLVAAV